MTTCTAAIAATPAQIMRFSSATTVEGSPAYAAPITKSGNPNIAIVVQINARNALTLSPSLSIFKSLMLPPCFRQRSAAP